MDLFSKNPIQDRTTPLDPVQTWAPANCKCAESNDRSMNADSNLQAVFRDDKKGDFVTEKEENENAIEKTCDDCAWKSKEDMVTGVFMMPKGLFEAIENARGKVIDQEACEENCSEIFYGRRIIFGVTNEMEKKRVMRKLEQFFESVESF